jgi:uncharacterized membrane protein
MTPSSKVLSWQQVALVIIGAVLVAVGVISLIDSLPISSEAKQGILLGLGIGSVVIGYFLLKSRPPKNTQKTPTIIKDTDNAGDECNRSDREGRKLSHIPNILRKAFTANNAPNTTQKIPNICLAIFFAPYIFRVFPSLSFSDKIVVISFIVLAVVICILQVIIANKNSEIRRLRKDRDSLITTMPPEYLTEHGKKTTKYSHEGDNVDDSYK